MADDDPKILYSQFCDLAFIEYDDWKWGKKYNCGTAGRGKNFRFTKKISKLQEAINNKYITYSVLKKIPEIPEIPENYNFQRKSIPLSKSFWFVGALIYHPALRMFISHVPNNLDNANPDIVPKLFTRFFVEEENDINLTQNIISLSSRNSSLPINNSFYTDYYSNRVKRHFGWNGNPIVDSLFRGVLTKTLTQFIVEASRLETTKQFNPFNVINQYNTGDKIIAEMGIPFLIAGYYDGGNNGITLYPNIPVYQFLLKDRAAYNNEITRLARIEAARLARERALIASVVAIHANEAEEPRPLVRDADEDEEDRVEAANKAVVASIVAINSEEEERQRLAREAAQLAREAARLAREAEEAARLAEAEAAVRDAANKAVVASIVAINSEQAAARLAARLAAQHRQAEAERLAAQHRQAEAEQQEAERQEEAAREAVNKKAIIAVIAAINAENAAQHIEEEVEVEEVIDEEEEEEEEIEEPVVNNKAVVASIVAINSEQAARLAADEAAARLAADEAAARIAREEANKKAVVASIVAINSEQAARLAADEAAARLAADEAAARLAADEAAARIAREEANKKAVVASIVAINSEQAVQIAREGDAEEEEDEPAPIVNNDSNNIAAIIAAIIQQPRQPLVRVPSSDNKIPSIIAAIMDTTRNHIVRVSELETLLNRLDFLWFINQLKCSEKYKSDEIVRDFTENKRDYNENIHRLTELRDRNTEGSVLYSKYNDELTDLENSWRDDEKNIEYQQYRQSIIIPIQKINIKKDGIELVNQKLQQENANKQIEDNKKLKIEYANKIIDSEKEHIFCKYYEHTHSTHINELKQLFLQNVNKLLAVPKFKNYTIQDTIYKTLSSEFIYDIFYKIIIKTTIVYDANDPIYIKRELNRDYLNIIGNITNQLRIPSCENISFINQNQNKDYYDKYNTSVLIEGFKKHCERRKLAFYNSVEFRNSYDLHSRGGDDADRDDLNSGGDGFKSKEQVRLENQKRLENFNKKKKLLSDAKDKAHARTEKNNEDQKQKAIENQTQRNLYNNFMRYINNNKILKENMIFYWGSDENKHFEHYNSVYNSEDRLKLTRLYDSQAGFDEEINNFLMDSSTPNLKIKFFIFFCIGFLYNDAVIFYRKFRVKATSTNKPQFGMDVNNQGEYYNDNTVKDNILYCTSTGNIPNIEYTDYTDAQGVPDNMNTENDNCKGSNCYPTMDVVENPELTTGKSAKLVKKSVGERGGAISNLKDDH